MTNQIKNFIDIKKIADTKIRGEKAITFPLFNK